MKILKRQNGFTLVELLVTMVIFVLVITAASNIFIGLLANFKQQSRLAESSIEEMVGLKMLKTDVELTGYGLPYDMDGASYANEAVDNPNTAHNEAAFNDAPNGAPRAFQTASGGFNNADTFIIKGSVYGINGTTQKWAYMTNMGGILQLKTWTDLQDSSIMEENIQNGDNIIVLRPTAGSKQKILIHNSSRFYTTVPNWTGFSPDQDTETYLLYGLTPTGTTPRMPFNRADFYVRRPAGAGAMPSHCQATTVILYKALVNHANGGTVEYPLLDCVATMRVAMMVDADEDDSTPLTAATAGAWPTAATTAEEIRKQLKEIRIYILAQEGQRDPNYQSPPSIDINDPDAGTLQSFAVPDRNYRWKIYTMVIYPYNLR